MPKCEKHADDLPGEPDGKQKRNGDNVEEKVSIVMPVYNAERYLRGALDGILKQTYRNIEVLCVDDGSTDGSPALLEEYRNRDTRVRVIHQENQRAGAARNNGMEQATGTYLMFVDADDVFEEDMVETLVRTIDRGNASLAVCNHYVFSGDLKNRNANPAPDFPEGTVSPQSLGKKLFQVCLDAPWNKLIRRDFLEKTGLHYQNLRANEDVSFNQLLLAEAEKIAFTKKCCLNYRINNADSVQGKRIRYHLDFVSAIATMYDEMQKRGTFSSFSEAFYAWVGTAVRDHLLDETDYAGYAELASVLCSELFPKIGFCANTAQALSSDTREVLLPIAEGNFEKSVFSLFRQTCDGGIPRDSAEYRIGQKLMRKISYGALPAPCKKFVRKIFRSKR